MDTDEINSGGSAFWIFITLIALVSLIFIMIWSYHAKSAQGAILALIFFAMISASAFLSRLKVFDWASWGDNTLSFTIGFAGWALLGSLSSLSVVSQNHLFASISSELPIILELSTTVFLIPIAEEMFWMVGLPFALITMMSALGRKYPVWESGWLQIPILILVGAVSFAYFHVGKVFIGFIIVAMVFRTVMMFLVYGEHYFDIIKKVNLVAGFALGAHIANNLITFGFNNAWLTVKSNFWPAGFLIIAFLLLMFGSGIEKIISLLSGKSSEDKVLSLKN